MFAVLQSVSLALRYLLFYIFITDCFGEIYIFLKGDTVLIHCCHLIWAVTNYWEDLNLV
jgi:hypothetical protein